MRVLHMDPYVICDFFVVYTYIHMHTYIHIHEMNQVNFRRNIWIKINLCFEIFANQYLINNLGVIISYLKEGF